jgi:hypothetical protein
MSNKSTITRKQYKSRMDNLTAHLLSAQSQRDDLVCAYEDAISQRGHEQWPAECESLADRLNALHDQIYAIEQQVRCLEDEWSTRRWTTQEWTAWDLITSNVD